MKNLKTISNSTAPVAHGVGRRKSAVARIWLKRGKGDVTINKMDYAQYFDTEVARLAAVEAFSVYPDAAKYYSVEGNVSGGGKRAQADAVKLGIARALLITDETLKPMLRQNGLLTVDARLKERKKYGQRGARRKFQFVKR